MGGQVQWVDRCNGWTGAMRGVQTFHSVLPLSSHSPRGFLREPFVQLFVVCVYLTDLYATVRRLYVCWPRVPFRCALTSCHLSCHRSPPSWHHHCRRLSSTQPARRSTPVYLWLPVRYLCCCEISMVVVVKFSIANTCRYLFFFWACTLLG